MTIQQYIKELVMWVQMVHTHLEDGTIRRFGPIKDLHQWNLNLNLQKMPDLMASTASNKHSAISVTKST